MSKQINCFTIERPMYFFFSCVTTRCPKMKTGAKCLHSFPPSSPTSPRLVFKSSSERKNCWTPPVRLDWSETIHYFCQVLSSSALPEIWKLILLRRAPSGYNTQIWRLANVSVRFKYFGAETHWRYWEKLQGEVNDLVHGGVNILSWIIHTFSITRKVRALLSTDAGAMGVDVKSTRLVVICSATSTTSGFQQEVKSHLVLEITGQNKPHSTETLGAIGNIKLFDRWAGLVEVASPASAYFFTEETKDWLLRWGHFSRATELFAWGEPSLTSSPWRTPMVR